MSLEDTDLTPSLYTCGNGQRSSSTALPLQTGACYLLLAKSFQAGKPQKHTPESLQANVCLHTPAACMKEARQESRISFKLHTGDEYASTSPEKYIACAGMKTRTAQSNTPQGLIVVASQEPHVLSVIDG